MGVDWDKQTRDPVTGRWYSDDPRFERLILRLTDEDRKLIEDGARRSGLSMTEFVLTAVRADAARTALTP